jgi:hypothetical protein
MPVITLLVGSVGLFVVAFLAWYSVWHRRLASRFERVRVESGRSRQAREHIELRRDPE